MPCVVIPLLAGRRQGAAGGGRRRQEAAGGGRRRQEAARGSKGRQIGGKGRQIGGSPLLPSSPLVAILCL